jgi:hypothetical protein
MNAQLSNFDAKFNQAKLNQIKKLALTGLDHQTDIRALVQLAIENPFLEKESLRIDDWFNEMAVRRAATSFILTNNKVAL